MIVVLLDSFVDGVGQVDHVHGLHGSGGGGCISVGGGVIVGFVQKRLQKSQDDVEEGQETEADDNREEEIAVQGVSHLETAVDAESVVDLSETGVNSAFLIQYLKLEIAHQNIFHLRRVEKNIFEINLVKRHIRQSNQSQNEGESERQ